MEPYSQLVVPAVALAMGTCAATVVLAYSGWRSTPRSTLTVEQWLTGSLLAQGESTGLPSTFAQDLIRCEHRDASAMAEGSDNEGRRASVVLERPYVKALAAQIEAVASGGVWPAPPQIQNPELAALELDPGPERERWLATVTCTMSAGLDLTSTCKMLANLGTRGIGALLGQR